jgi:putative ABC transport system ATP-binding protein
MAASILQLREIRKTYRMGLVTVEALRGVSIDVCSAEYVSIMGPSGCGKSTLLNLLGCLDRPSSGRYVLGSEDISQLDDDALSGVRGSRLGFIFQSYNLIQQLTVVENIEVPLYYQGRPEAESRALAQEVATRVGLADRLEHKPYELSGGQQQRVAIARSLVNDPLMILADEPTGNLDSKTGAEVLDLITRLNQGGKTIILVTHDDKVAQRAHRVVRMKDGRIDQDVLRELPSAAVPVS